MFDHSSLTVIPRSHLINVFAKIREEWEEAADSSSLIDMNASVGMLLADMVVSIGLTTSEQEEVFGSDLARDLELLWAETPLHNEHI